MRINFRIEVMKKRERAYSTAFKLFPSFKASKGWNRGRVDGSFSSINTLIVASFNDTILNFNLLTLLSKSATTAEPLCVTLPAVTI